MADPLVPSVGDNNPGTSPSPEYTKGPIDTSNLSVHEQSVQNWAKDSCHIDKPNGMVKILRGDTIEVDHRTSPDAPFVSADVFTGRVGVRKKDGEILAEIEHHGPNPRSPRRQTGWYNSLQLSEMQQQQRESMSLAGDRMRTAERHGDIAQAGTEAVRCAVNLASQNATGDAAYAIMQRAFKSGPHR